MAKRLTLIEKLDQTKKDIDELVELRAKLKPLQNREKELADKLRQQLKYGLHDGHAYRIEIKYCPENRIDVKALRAEYESDPIWLARWEKEIPVTKIFVKPKTVADSPKSSL